MRIYFLANIKTEFAARRLVAVDFALFAVIYDNDSSSLT